MCFTINALTVLADDLNMFFQCITAVIETTVVHSCRTFPKNNTNNPYVSLI